MRATLIMCLVSVIGTACASSQANLVRESARFMGTLPEDVAVSNVDRKASSVTWLATSPTKGVWSCSSDDMMRRPLCVKQDSTGRKP